MSRHDAQTGIPNRRQFDDFEEHVWKLAARDETAASIVLLDIDFFKIYNDTLGHQAGDECLKSVAQALKSANQRPFDLVARFGGEEFVAILGSTTLDRAIIVAERMRQAIVDLAIAHPGSSDSAVTVSIGVALTFPKSGETSREVIARADEALYYAKAAGRNCVVYKEAGEYVTNDAPEDKTSATNVLAILRAT